MEDKKLNCCELGSKWINYIIKEYDDEVDRDGFCIDTSLSYPDPAWILINYCPFCGKEIQNE